MDRCRKTSDWKPPLHGQPAGGDRPARPSAVGQQHISVESLAVESFWCASRFGHAGRDGTFFRRPRLEIQSSMEMSSNEAIKQAVQAGLGLGILSLQTWRWNWRSSVLRCSTSTFSHHASLVHRPPRRQAALAVAQAFKEFVLGRSERAATMCEIRARAPLLHNTNL